MILNLFEVPGQVRKAEYLVVIWPSIAYAGRIDVYFFHTLKLGQLNGSNLPWEMKGCVKWSGAFEPKDLVSSAVPPNQREGDKYNLPLTAQSFDVIPTDEGEFLTQRYTRVLPFVSGNFDATCSNVWLAPEKDIETALCVALLLIGVSARAGGDITRNITDHF